MNRRYFLQSSLSGVLSGLMPSRLIAEAGANDHEFKLADAAATEFTYAGPVDGAIQIYGDATNGDINKRGDVLSVSPTDSPSEIWLAIGRRVSPSDIFLEMAHQEEEMHERIRLNTAELPFTLDPVIEAADDVRRISIERNRRDMHQSFT